MSDRNEAPEDVRWEWTQFAFALFAVAAFAIVARLSGTRSHGHVVATFHRVWRSPKVRFVAASVPKPSVSHPGS